jgi:hypothetical protein
MRHRSSVTLSFEGSLRFGVPETRRTIKSNEGCGRYMVLAAGLDKDDRLGIGVIG